jgi:hypothetical protein
MSNSPFGTVGAVHCHVQFLNIPGIAAAREMVASLNSFH